MLRIKGLVMAVAMLGLLTTSITGFAGRYGEAEIRHSQAVAKAHEKQNAQPSNRTAAKPGEHAARQSGGFYPRSPFQKNNAG